MPSRRAVVVPLLITGALVVGPTAERADAKIARVDAATVMVAASWDVPSCDVRVHRATGGVNLACWETGSAAIMLRVPLRGVVDEQDIQSIRVDDTGSSESCADAKTRPARVRNGTLRLIYAHVGTFDCWYRSVQVRYRPEK
jgi:hypothetical protein